MSHDPQFDFDEVPNRRPGLLGSKPFSQPGFDPAGPLRPNGVRRPTVPPFALPAKRAVAAGSATTKAEPIAENTGPVAIAGALPPYVAPSLTRESPFPHQAELAPALDTASLTRASLDGTFALSAAAPLELRPDGMKVAEQATPVEEPQDWFEAAEDEKEGPSSADPRSATDWSSGFFGQTGQGVADAHRDTSAGESFAAEQAEDLSPDRTAQASAAHLLERADGEPSTPQLAPDQIDGREDDAMEWSVPRGRVQDPESPAAEPLRAYDLAAAEDELRAFVSASQGTERATYVMEAVARRVRSGEIVVPVDANASEAAVLAHVLTALLQDR